MFLFDKNNNKVYLWHLSKTETTKHNMKEEKEKIHRCGQI